MTRFVLPLSHGRWLGDPLSLTIVEHLSQTHGIARAGCGPTGHAVQIVMAQYDQPHRRDAYVLVVSATEYC